MKKLLCSLVFMALTLGMVSAQKAKTDANTTDKMKAENAESTTKVKGYPPNGYPCLDCIPCVSTGKATEYCAADKSKKVKPHPQALELGFVYSAGKMVSVDAYMKDEAVMEKLTELGVSTSKQKVQCSCGKAVYGKDVSACSRICEFLRGGTVAK